jgi:subtilisin family serine protease
VRVLTAIALAAAVATAVVPPGGAATGRLDGDPLQAQEWWLTAVGADRAAPPGPGVPITIVDSGLDATHPEFAGRPGTTLLNQQVLAGPDDSHGTAVASIAAAPENGTGMVGVYPQASLQSWDASPRGRVVTLSAAEGILAAARHCPGVVNLSFGTTTPSPLLEEAVLAAFHDGCLVVVAAGNERADGNPASYPAALPHVLTVAATDSADHVAAFSTASPANDLAAPGDGLVAAVPPGTDAAGYETVSGTSFSAPIVSAAAAWVWTQRPSLDVGQVFDLLRTSARDVGPPGFDPDTGFGIVDIATALTAPAPPHDPLEPNDDVDQVKPGTLFADGQPALTTAARPSQRIAGSLDVTEDPRDLYRIWVPAHRVVRVGVSANGDAAARIWGPLTVSVHERLAARRRDLRGRQIAGGKRGMQAYVEVLPTGGRSQARYVLSVRASKR